MRNELIHSAASKPRPKARGVEGLIKKAVTLGKKIGYCFLTTADDRGVAHLTVAAKIDINPDNKLSIASWFCLQTVENLEKNPSIGVIVWNKETDIGYQLLGQKESLREVAVLNGYAPKLEKNEHLPQVEREIVINVENVFEFKQAAHSDRQL